MAAVSIRVSGGAKRYSRGGRSQPVFASIDLEVEDGQLFVLLGPSGCGKSTLLRTIAGLEPLSDGAVEVRPGSAGQRGVAIAFQQPLLLPWLNVRENVALGLRYRANRDAAGPGIVERTLAEFGIAELAEAYPEELSGGQAQRVSVARTAVTRPRAILLDEPFGALDPLTRASMQNWLLGIQQELGLTVVLVTHDIEEAVYLGDHVALMSPAPGTVQHTWEVPREARTSRDDERLARVRAEILARYAELEPQASGESATERAVGAAGERAARGSPADRRAAIPHEKGIS